MPQQLYAAAVGEVYVQQNHVNDPRFQDGHRFSTATSRQHLPNSFQLFQLCFQPVDNGSVIVHHQYR
ncbi:MAG TPA: hypothetical protein VL547_07685 [Dinghuibacter sp.]|nr:hypothetical protein [Dinghuibacter sp.]HTJ11889.1 hypothetical protein [Dinghuibacter sp.]